MRIAVAPLFSADQLGLCPFTLRMALPYFFVDKPTFVAMFGREEDILHALRRLTLGMDDLDQHLEAEDRLIDLLGEQAAADAIQGWHAAFQSLKRPSKAEYRKAYTNPAHVRH
jgi:hypothetical protein